MIPILSDKITVMASGSMSISTKVGIVKAIVIANKAISVIVLTIAVVVVQ